MNINQVLLLYLDWTQDFEYGDRFVQWRYRETFCEIPIHEPKAQSH